MTVSRALVCCVGLQCVTACSPESTTPPTTTETTTTTTDGPSSTPSTTTSGALPSSTGVPSSTTSQVPETSQPEAPSTSDGPTSSGTSETDESAATTSISEPTPTTTSVSSDTVASEETTDGSGPAKQTWVFTTSSGGPLRAFEQDAETGALDARGEQSVGSGPNEDVFVAMVPGSTQAFVVTTEAIVVYDFDPATGSFTEGAHGTTLGTGTYVSVSADLQHVYVAHYNDNALSYLTYKDGVFSAPQRFDSGQKVHSVQEAKAGGWVLVPCLGSDHVAQYRRDGDTLTAATPATVAVTGGPRHFAFHPSKPVAYVLTELTAQLRAFEFTEAAGLGAVLDTEVIGVESGGKYWGSDVKVSPDGNDVFAVERNAKKVYHFDIEEDGTLTSSGISVDLGGVVRAFDISSDGKRLYMGNNQGQIKVLTFDSQSNELVALPDGPTGAGTIYNTLVREF